MQIELVIGIIVAIIGCSGFWSYLATRFTINKKLSDNIDKALKEIEETNAKIDKNEIINCRIRIIRFNKELIRKELQTHDEFSSALEACDIYEKGCEKYPDLKDNRALLTVENIKRCYNEYLTTGKFIDNN